eukprot:TRINITY_DN3502_c0_g1_i1.p1 TRINITY_DN3502_c0_g1~~TRINITY_DN3502_c0_g1_i1.p1  ORF type:complete len:787 (+),score=207.98 TRINITY_DN3502_c0_g1_i1:77-2362(+)
MRASAALPCLLAAAGAAIPDPSRFKGYLDENISPGSKMPLSYMVYPKDYFDKVPDSEKKHDYKNATFSYPCNKRWVQPAQMEKYEFQTETYLTSLGLNIYDGAVWCIAQSLLGNTGAPQSYIDNVLVQHKTAQFNDIRGDAKCGGDLYSGGCKDPTQSGACGFCYGDNLVTLDKDHAFFFRMIGDYYGLQGTVDQRCPDLGHEWTWNDYKPVLGENAWANYLGPLTVSYIAGGKSPSAVSGSAMTLATNLLVGLRSMRVGDLGGYFYSPHNAYFRSNMNAGSTVSIENQASLLAGLKAFRWVLASKGSSYHDLWCEVDDMIAGLEKFILSAWNPTKKFFRQGGTYDPKTKTFQWVQGDSPEFAVDCQTWVSTVLGPELIDKKFGKGTSADLWKLVKQRAGYGKQASGLVKGVGYTDNSLQGEVYSGEWTFGAINWLRVLANYQGYSSDVRSELATEATYMRQCIEDELTVSTPVQKGTTNRPSVLYADKRYYIPFGWWANRLPATASTGWAVAVDKNWNPFMLNGEYTSTYPDVVDGPSACPPPPPTPTGPPRTPAPPPGACSPCKDGPCCDPTVPTQKCPGNIECCDCGSHACECPTTTPAPAPHPTPAPAPGPPTPPTPPTPTPPPGPGPSPACAVCGKGPCCSKGQFCMGGVPCCDCGADSCQCSTGPPPAPTPPPGSCSVCGAGKGPCCSKGQVCLDGSACCDCGAPSCQCPSSPAPPSPPPGQCSVCGAGPCCSKGQICISGKACCDCGAASCQCQ